MDKRKIASFVAHRHFPGDGDAGIELLGGNGTSVCLGVDHLFFAVNSRQSGLGFL